MSIAISGDDRSIAMGTYVRSETELATGGNWRRCEGR